jgi:hypothetical protein
MNTILSQPAPVAPAATPAYLVGQLRGSDGALEWVWSGSPRFVDIDVNPDGTANIQARALPAAALAALLRALPAPRG